MNRHVQIVSKQPLKLPLTQCFTVYFAFLPIGHFIRNLSQTRIELEAAAHLLTVAHATGYLNPLECIDSSLSFLSVN